MSGEYVRSCTDRQEKAIGGCWRCETKDATIEVLRGTVASQKATIERLCSEHDTLEATIARYKELINSVALKHSLDELADDDEWVHVPRWFIEALLEQEK